MTSPGNPTLLEIARTIIAAAKCHDEDPLDVASGAMGSRARWLAFAALMEAFPHVYFRDIAKWCGFLDRENAGSARSALKYNRDHQKWKWWREDDLATVKAVLARAIVETDGRPLSGNLPSTEGEKQDTAPPEPLELFTVTLPETGGAETAVSDPEKPAEPTNTAPLAVAPNPPALVPEILRPLPIEADRVARVERIKAFADGEPPRAREIVEIEATVVEALPQPNPSPPPVCQLSAAAKALTSAALLMQTRKRVRLAPPIAASTSAELTSAFFGDPPPGRREMLERMRATERRSYSGVEDQ